jgi:hypothetical protein
MHDKVIRAIPATMYVPQFKLQFHVMRLAGMGDYFPMRSFCEKIGLAPQAQQDKVRADANFEDGLETLTIPTLGGPQEALCIRKRELAWWLATLEPRTIKKLEDRFKTTLDEFKQAVMDAADALWWGDVNVNKAAGARDEEPRGALYLHCRRCHARHRLELHSHGDFDWEIDDSE